MLLGGKGGKNIRSGSGPHPDVVGQISPSLGMKSVRSWHYFINPEPDQDFIKKYILF